MSVNGDAPRLKKRARVESAQDDIPVFTEASPAVPDATASGSKGKEPASLPKPPKAPRPFACSECSKAFRLTEELRKHLDAKHRASKKVPCPFCGELLKRDRKNPSQLKDAEAHWAKRSCRKAQAKIEYARQRGPHSPSKTLPFEKEHPENGKKVTDASLGQHLSVALHESMMEPYRREYMEELKEASQQASLRFVGDLKDESGSFKFEVHDRERLPPFTSVWRNDERDRFFYALARFSRLRPDMIAEHIGTRTLAEVDAYIQLLASHAATVPPLPRDQQPAAIEVTESWVRFEERQSARLASEEKRKDALLPKGLQENMSWRVLCLLGEDHAEELEDWPATKSLRKRQSSEETEDSESDASADQRDEGGGSPAANGDANEQNLSRPDSPLADDVLQAIGGALTLHDALFSIPEHDGPVSPDKAALATTHEGTQRTASSSKASNRGNGVSYVSSESETDVDEMVANELGQAPDLLAAETSKAGMKRAQQAMRHHKLKLSDLGQAGELFHVHAIGALIDAYFFVYGEIGPTLLEGHISKRALTKLYRLVKQHTRDLLVRVSRLAEIRHAGTPDEEQLDAIVSEVVRHKSLKGRRDTTNTLLSLRTEMAGRAHFSRPEILTPFFATCPNCKEELCALDVDINYEQHNRLGLQPEWLNVHTSKCKAQTLETPSLPMPVPLYSTLFSSSVQAAYTTSAPPNVAPAGSIALPHVFEPELVRGHTVDFDSLDVELADIDEKAEQDERWEEVHLHYKERLRDLQEEARLWKEVAGEPGHKLPTIKAPQDWVDEPEEKAQKGPEKPSASSSAPRPLQKRRKTEEIKSKEMIDTSDEESSD